MRSSTILFAALVAPFWALWSCASQPREETALRAPTESARPFWQAATPPQPRSAELQARLKIAVGDASRFSLVSLAETNDIERLLSTDAFIFSLIGDAAVTTTTGKRGTNAWELTNAEGERVILTKNSDGYRGAIRLKNAAYRVDPLGDGFHVVSEIQRPSTPDDAASKVYAFESGGKPTATCQDEVIKILPVYRKDVPDSLGSVTVEKAIDDFMVPLNTAFADAKTGITAVALTPYALTKDSEATVADELTWMLSSGPKKALETKRTSEKADIVILITTASDACGAVPSNVLEKIIATPGHAYGVISVGLNDCDDHRLAHEVGHIMGLRHHSDFGTTGVIAAAGAYGFCTWDFGTIMMDRVTCVPSRGREPAWSDPTLKKYEDLGVIVAAGDHDHNTATVLGAGGHARIAAGFICEKP